jgi:DNA-directed RNA polymerase specialized sigma24 family protein
MIKIRNEPALFDAAGKDLRGWLIQTARQQTIKHLRRISAQKRGAGCEFVAIGKLHDVLPAPTENKDDLTACMHALIRRVGGMPERCAHSYLATGSMRAAAVQLGLSQEGVRYHLLKLRRAWKSLKKQEAAA